MMKLLKFSKVGEVFGVLWYLVMVLLLVYLVLKACFVLDVSWWIVKIEEVMLGDLFLMDEDVFDLTSLGLKA